MRLILPFLSLVSVFKVILIFIFIFLKRPITVRDIFSFLTSVTDIKKMLLSFKLGKHCFSLWDVVFLTSSRSLASTESILFPMKIVAEGFWWYSVEFIRKRRKSLIYTMRTNTSVTTIVKCNILLKFTLIFY